MSISKKDLQLLLEDQFLQDSFQHLSHIEDHFGFNYIPSTRINIFSGVPLICLRRAWGPIQLRVETVYPEIFYFFLQHTNIFDKQKVEAEFKEVVQAIILKVDHFEILCDIVFRALHFHNDNTTELSSGFGLAASPATLALINETAEELVQVII